MSWVTSLVFELIGEAYAAARIVLRRGSLCRGDTVAQSRLQLQMLRQVHVGLQLTGAARVLPGFDINAAGNITPGFDACTAVRGSVGGCARGRADGQSIQSQTFLQFCSGVQAHVAAHAAHGSERRADLR